MNILIFLILGFLTSILFPPYFFLPLGFIIFPFLCLIIEKNLKKLNNTQSILYSFSFAFAFFISLLFWLKNPFFVFEETKNFFLISVFLIILLSLIFSLIFFIFLRFNKFIPTLFLVPIIFISFEFIISIILYGFPWISFSLIISSNDYLILLPKYFGTFVTSYLLLQAYCLPYIFLQKKINYYELRNFLIILIPPIIILIFSNILFNQNDKDYTKKIDIEIFQLNFKNNIKVNSSERLDTIIDYVKNSSSELLIFAENNYPFLIKDVRFNEIQNFIKEGQTVIIGGSRLETNKYYNTLLNISSYKISYFDKKILVPFGEFLPFRNFLNFLDIISGPEDFSSGVQDRIININKKLNYIPVICYEIIFYWKIINNKNINSDFIVNITNDIWFGKYLGPYQHFYFSKLRASEFNKPIIRVSNNGISGIINSDGKIISFIELNKSRSIRLNINFKDNNKYYKMHYYLNIYFLIILLLLAVPNFRNK